MSLLTPFSRRYQSFIYGLQVPFEAMKMILKKRSLFIMSLIPIALTLVLYVYVIDKVQHSAQNFVLSYINAWGLSPEGWFTWFILFATKIVLIIVSALTFSFAATILGSPINDFLAERTEKFVEPALPTVPDMPWTHQFKLIGVDIIKSIAATSVGLIAILLSWVPVVNFAAFAVAFLLVTFQYISYPQTRRGISLGRSLSFLWHHLWACLGFGAIISGIFALPFISCLGVPLAVVGGTILVARAPGDSSELLELK